MAHVDQTQSFETRLRRDFNSEMSNFLLRAWAARRRVNLIDAEAGMWNLYDLYSAPERSHRYSRRTLLSFMRDLNQAAGGKKIIAQKLGTVSGASEAVLALNGMALWCEFFHVPNPDSVGDVSRRVYVNSATARAGVRIMRRLILLFPALPGFSNVKTCGPGAIRPDKIVAYMVDEKTRTAVLARLKQMTTSHAGWFTDELPSLVKRVDPGIGIADEPPAVELYRGEGARHSFGSFYSTLVWVALKTTPNVSNDRADPRHMLDNLLFSFRALRISPKFSHSFPERGAIEAWVKAVGIR